MTKTVVVDCFAESAAAYAGGYAAVAIDVIRATTTAITAVETGRECYPVPSIEAALPLAARLHDPLLAGELGGNMPYGFEVTNSPAELASRTDVERPLILLSTSGTKLIHESAAAADAVYVAALRNYSATARHLAERYDKVAVLGAGTRGEFRQEDQMCCALVAEKLLEAGFEPQDDRTDTIVRRWRDEPVDAITASKSVAYLRDTGQLDDLEFVLGHVDDVEHAFEFREGRVSATS